MIIIVEKLKLTEKLKFDILKTVSLVSSISSFCCGEDGTR